ncbi:hypothetical protein ACFXAW_00430 [Streptomyces sp. NPDC059445]|uniref:HflX-like GTP-binding protein n=1 Tax=unclassified Streptomyces TaxID=2593676 RepID=UPI003680ADB6
MRLTGADVVLVGYFSAKEKNFVALMDAAAEELTARGARIVGRITQRRGVSDGGARKMTVPYSSRTLLSSGKVLEVAARCEETEADLVVFATALTHRQQHVLTEIFDRPTVSLAAITADG